MTQKILQLSDCHLMETAEERLKGVPTAACLADVLDVVQQRHRDADLILFTGDLAAHAQGGAYRQMREICESLKVPCAAIPGNHDDRALMREILTDMATAVPGGIGFSIALGNWRLIGLDTLWEGEVAGELDEEQLAWLAEELSRHQEQPTLMFTHHPPISVQTPWLDRIMLQNPQPLAELLTTAPQVQGVFCGHVHQEYLGSLSDVPVYCTPSTAIQFTPGTVQLEFDDLPPGFRVIELDEERFQTSVTRLPELRYLAQA